MINDVKKFFIGKKITLMGLGLLGRGVGVAEFLASMGAKLTITDLKTDKELSPSLKRLKQFKNINYILGRHRLIDFKRADMVIKAAGVPLDSPFIEIAKKNNIPIEMDASLFARLAPAGVKIVGITGTRGKSTVTHLIYHILTSAGRRVFLGGNVKGLATLPLLKKVRAGDVVVLELDSWQLQGFGEASLSPKIAVFTTFMRDHQNYYKNNMRRYFADKANIYRHQKSTDILIVGRDVTRRIKKDKFKSKLIVTPKSWPIGFQTKLLGQHNKDNAKLAILVARQLAVPELKIKRGVASFPGVPGRLELIATSKGIKYYNDTTATTPEASIVAWKSFPNHQKKIVLIGGGSDKNLDYTVFARLAPKYLKWLILFPGLATNKIIAQLPKSFKQRVDFADNMSKALTLAKRRALSGDIVLLSPGAASFGAFNNEFDRGEQFIRKTKKYA